MHPCGCEAWRRWRAWLRAGHSPDTVRAYTGNAHRFLAETDCRPLTDYGEDAVADFFEEHCPRGKAKYEYAKALRSMFTWAVRTGEAARNPMEHIKLRKPRRLKGPALTIDELVRLLIAAWHELGERQAWAILLIYSLGLRRKEAAGLRWDDIREGNTGPVIEIRETKGADEREPLPLSLLALECLEHLQELPRPPQATLDPEYILGVKKATVSDWVHRAGVAACLHPKKVKAHRLRATLATSLLRAGVDISVVQRLLGHLRLESTAWYIEDPGEELMRAGLERTPRAA